MKWSNWITFSEIKLSGLPSAPAIYQIRCLGNNSKPIPVLRTNGADRDGILDIGHTNKMRVRMIDFWGAVNGNNSYSHSAAWRFCNYKLSKRFPIDKLQFRYFRTKSKGAARNIERKELMKYGKRFMELPPLNSSE